MRIDPLEGASQRTRNRIREHQNFKLLGRRVTQSVGDAYHVECRKCEWSGWLPVKEVRVVINGDLQ